LSNLSLALLRFEAVNFHNSGPVSVAEQFVVPALAGIPHDRCRLKAVLQTSFSIFYSLFALVFRHRYSHSDSVPPLANFPVNPGWEILASFTDQLFDTFCRYMDVPFVSQIAATQTNCTVSQIG